ncbi:MAG: DUF1501 domain-containing protein, partial [Opitutae bacterium]|nr:DUF1501 domain-containing protein [Opitutae bacterium]
MNRRSFISTMGGMALGSLFSRDGLLGAPGIVQPLHHKPRAKRVVQLFMAGAASHVDTFDYKPLLEKKDGQPWDPGEQVELFQSRPGATFA